MVKGWGGPKREGGGRRKVRRKDIDRDSGFENMRVEFLQSRGIALSPLAWSPGGNKAIVIKGEESQLSVSLETSVNER